MQWLKWAMWLQVAVAAGALIGMVADSRQLLGVSVWLKPFKFAVSIFVYLLTLGWMIKLYPEQSRLVQTMGAVAGLTMMIEIVLIAMQAARGVTSHFNSSTEFDAGVFRMMAFSILVNTIAVVVITFLFFGDSPEILATKPGLLWGIRWGLVIFLAGSAEALPMLSRMAHTVGASDGGSGLPLVNWSRSHGDLRAAHAMGLHGMQAIPFVGWMFDRFNLPAAGLVTSVAAAIYVAIFVVLLAQALAGRPVLG